jgi:hypothetical protein
VNDDAWDKQRSRAILAAFETGRPVFADTDGDLRYVDGTGERVPEDVGIAAQPFPRATALAIRAERASHWAFVTSIIAAIANTVTAYWHPWQIGVAVVCVGSAVVWCRVNRHQRAGLKGALR